MYVGGYRSNVIILENSLAFMVSAWLVTQAPCRFRAAEYL